MTSPFTTGFPPVLELLNARPAAVGKVFFVDGNSGSDSQEGTDPNFPLLKIGTAIGKCTENKNNYIIVLDCWNGDAGAIALNKHRTHVIGIGNSHSPYCMLAKTGDTNIFTVTGYYCEIAGFCIGGGSTKAGIEVNNASALWVHNCDFGNADVGDTPAYGILYTSGQINAYQFAEDCLFLGSGNSAQGRISADGVCAAGNGTLFRSSIVRKNIFNSLPGIAINIGGAYGASILENIIGLDADTAGAGITLSSYSIGCTIANNVANFGKGVCSNNPFVDGSTLNNWINNTKGIVLTNPA